MISVARKNNMKRKSKNYINTWLACLVMTVNYTNKVHDRFLIIDQKELYHIGASIKDLGQKCFAFELMEDSLSLIPELLAKL